MVTSDPRAAKQRPSPKYLLTSRSVSEGNKTLFQIQALRDIPSLGVHAGDFGGYIASERNLSQLGDCWVFDKAKVYDRAVVRDNATVHGNAIVKGAAVVRDHAKISGNASVSEGATIRDYARIDGEAAISGESVIKDYAVCGDDTMCWGSASVEGHVELYGTRVFDEAYYGDDVYFGQTSCPDGYIPDEFDH